MTPRTVLAIDQGTSGTKADRPRLRRRRAGVAEVPVRPRCRTRRVGRGRPAALLDSVLEAGRRALAAGARPVEAVSLANQGETVLAWDRTTGTPLSAAIVWQDRRAESWSPNWPAHASWSAARTGLVLDPYFSAPKMAWLRRNVTTDGVVTHLRQLADPPARAVRSSPTPAPPAGHC